MVFDVAVVAPAKWQTWVQGKFPDLVVEITSSSTRDVDLSTAPGGKRRLYADLGAREYYIFDPQGETSLPFLGYERRDGAFVPLPFLESGGS